MCLQGNFYETHGAGAVQEACGSLEEQFQDEAGALDSLFAASCSQQAQHQGQSCWVVSEVSEGGGESMGLEMNAIRARCERLFKPQLHLPPA